MAIAHEESRGAQAVGKRSTSHGAAARLRSIAAYGVLLAWLLIVVFPLIWLFFNSIRSSREIFQNPFGVPWAITGVPAGEADSGAPWQAAAQNYRTAWIESGFSRFFGNSVFVTLASLAGVLTCASLAAYTLARFRFRGNRALLLLFLSGLMIPAQLILVPLFFQLTWLSEWGSLVLRPLGYQLALHDSYTGLILVYVAMGLPFSIFLLVGFFRSLPEELREAAIVDGCGEFGVFARVMLPLARPGLVSAAIFGFLGVWNEYLFALVLITTDAKKTLPLGLASVSVRAQYESDFGLMFAGLAIVLVPTLLVYVLLQRHLTGSATVGALKG